MTPGITWVICEVIASLTRVDVVIIAQILVQIRASYFAAQLLAGLRPVRQKIKNFALFLSTHRVITFFAARLTYPYIPLHSAMFTAPLKLLQRVSRAAEDVDLSSSTQAISQPQNRALIPYITAQKEASLQAELTANRTRTAAAAKESQPKRTR
jgi:hypothetical protein